MRMFTKIGRTFSLHNLSQNIFVMHNLNHAIFTATLREIWTQIQNLAKVTLSEAIMPVISSFLHIIFLYVLYNLFCRIYVQKLQERLFVHNRDSGSLLICILQQLCCQFVINSWLSLLHCLLTKSGILCFYSSCVHEWRTTCADNSSVHVIFASLTYGGLTKKTMTKSTPGIYLNRVWQKTFTEQ